MASLIGNIKFNGADYFVSPADSEPGVLLELSGDYEAGFSETGRTFKADDVVYSLPFKPGKLIGIGKNYPEPEQTEEAPINFFIMAHNALLPHREPLRLSHRIGSILPEGELAVVIGKELRSASLGEAEDSILGYTICNDFSARDTKPPESNAAIRKSSDGLLPMGPYLHLNSSLDDYYIKTYCDGELIQQGSTDSMIHKIPELISYISDYMTLSRFDVISTGTPGPKIKCTRGNKLKVEINGIGSLENEIK